MFQIASAAGLVDTALQVTDVHNWQTIITQLSLPDFLCQPARIKPKRPTSPILVRMVCENASLVDM